MDYSRGVLKPTNTSLFPDLRRNLGPYLVDKTELIENVILNNRTGDVGLVLRPRRCGKSTMLQIESSSNYVGLYPHSVLKLFDQVISSPSLEMMIPTRVCFSKAYISRPDRMSAQSTWESTL